MRTIDVILKYNAFTDFVFSDGFNWLLREQYKALGALYTDVVDRDAQLDVILMHDRVPQEGDFLYGEVEAFLRAFPSSVVLARIDSEFNRKCPEIASRIIQDDEGFALKLAKVVYVATLSLTVYALARIEAAGVPFIFELDPEGGFVFDHPDIDLRLKRISQSPFFAGVVVPSESIRSYVVNNKIFSADQVHVIPARGAPKPDSRLLAPVARWGWGDKARLDVCFVSEQNVRVGEDGCYGLFVEAANILAKKYHDICFHVVGAFKVSMEGIEFIGDRIKFYGEVDAIKFADLSTDMDIVLSLNANGAAFAPGLEGRSLDRVIASAVHGAAIFTSADAANVDSRFSDGVNFVRVRHDVADIVGKIERFYADPAALRAVGNGGARLIAEISKPELQFTPRIEIVRAIATGVKRSAGALALKSEIAALATGLAAERAQMVAARMRSKRWLYLVRGGLRLLSGRSNLKMGQLVQILRSSGLGAAARAVLVSGV